MAKEGTLLDLLEPRGFWEDRKTAFVFWDGEKLPIEKLPISKQLSRLPARYQEKIRTLPYSNLGKLSYGNLRKYSSAFAYALKEKFGVESGERVGLMIPNMLQFPIAYFGIQKAGGIAVPLNPLYSSEWLAKVLNDADIRTIFLLDFAFLSKLNEIKEKTPLKNIITTNISDSLPILKKIHVGERHSQFTMLLAEYFGRNVQVKIRPDNIALLLYTSGTTGEPKGVIHTHESLLANAQACQELVKELGLEDGKEIFLASAPYFHITGLATMLHTPLLAKAKTVLIPNPLEFRALLSAITYARPTAFVGFPSQYVGMHTVLSKNPEAYDISSLEVCISGSSRLGTETRKNFELLWGGKIREGYGLSEGGITHCQRTGEEVGAVGRPLNRVTQIIFDSDENRIGELRIHSKYTMNGYWKKPEETAEVLTANGWLCTGDLAKMNTGGSISIVGRVSEDMMKGPNDEKIYFDEIEKVLVANPFIKEAAVVEGKEKRCAAYIVLNHVEDDTLRALEFERLKPILRLYLTQNLEPFKVPRKIHCLKELPRNAMGKVLKKVLRASS